MFVFSSTYATLEEKFKELKRKYNNLFEDWEELVRLINKKGGEKFIKEGVILSKDTIESLIILCHPDKHNNSDRSQEIIKKLLEIRK